MPAGPEMEALVAKEVMGYTVEFQEGGSEGGRVERVWFIVADENQTGRPAIPKYSTDIRAAWKVARKLQSQGDALTLQRREMIDGAPGTAIWTAWLQKSKESGWAVTPPLAICRASLLAVRHNEQHPAKQVTGNLFSVIELELAKVMGPIARVIVKEKIAEFGETRDSFPEDRVEPFVKAISEEIDDSSGKAMFTTAMADFLSKSSSGSQ